MSDNTSIATPLTDQEVRLVWSESNEGMGEDYGEFVVPASFAKELEVKVEELRKRNELLTSANEDTKRIADERNRLHVKLKYLLNWHDEARRGHKGLMEEKEWDEIREMLRPPGV